MQYTYETPKSDVYAFFVFSLIGAAYGLVSNLPYFYKSIFWDITVTLSFYSIVYLWPGVIYLRAALRENPSGSWPTAKRFYIVQAAIDCLLLVISVILFLGKLLGDPFVRRWSLDEDLRDSMGSAGDVGVPAVMTSALGLRGADGEPITSTHANDDGPGPLGPDEESVDGVQENAGNSDSNDGCKKMKPAGGTPNGDGSRAERGVHSQTTKLKYLDDNKRRRFLRSWAMYYFASRYLFGHFFYVPLVTIITLVFIALYQRPQVGFNDILFFCTAPTGLALFYYGLKHIGTRLWALAQVIIMWYSIQLCYFIADSNLLVDFQLGFLVVYLSSVFGMITHEKKASFRVGEWFCFQRECWRKRMDEDDLAGITKPQEKGRRQNGQRRYFGLFEFRNPFSGGIALAGERKRNVSADLANTRLPPAAVEMRERILGQRTSPR